MSSPLAMTRPERVESDSAARVGTVVVPSALTAAELIQAGAKAVAAVAAAAAAFGALCRCQRSTQ